MFHRTIELNPAARSSRAARRPLCRLAKVGGAAGLQARRYANTARSSAQRCLQALRDSGFEDVLSIVVGTEVVYACEQPGLGEWHAAVDALSHYALPDGDVRIRIAASREHGELHSLVVASIGARGSLRWSSRVIGLRVTRDEQPAQYQRRVHLALEFGLLSRCTVRAQAASDTLVDALVATFGPNTVNASVMKARIVLPGPSQVGRFRHLGFGDRVRGRTYRAVRHKRHHGANDDPHTDHFYDPYHDLLSWIVILAARDGLWTPQDVSFVDMDGQPLIGGVSSSRALALPRNPIRIQEFGLDVDESIPQAKADLSEAGSGDTPR